MEFTQNGTTNRYKGNEKSNYKNDIEDIYQYGCEFEFYINSMEFELDIEKIKNQLYKITNRDILVDLVSLPNDIDKDHCMQIKPDISLEDNGIEISTPISSRKGIEHYIDEICTLINNFGYTNVETGMHIHISTVCEDGVNFNFYKFMLLCDDSGLLSKWEIREGYSHNVMDVLSKNTKHNARSIKTKKGKIWNLERISNNHIEIKSIGGINYQVDPKRLIDEFNQYADFFDETLQQDTEIHRELYSKHKAQVEIANPNTQKLFALALEESGILSKKT